MPSSSRLLTTTSSYALGVESFRSVGVMEKKKIATRRRYCSAQDVCPALVGRSRPDLTRPRGARARASPHSVPSVRSRVFLVFFWGKTNRALIPCKKYTEILHAAKNASPRDLAQEQEVAAAFFYTVDCLP